MNPRMLPLCAAVLVWTCLIGSSKDVTSGEPSTRGKFILSAPLTHSDWVLKDNVPGLDDGLGGVRHMLDMCKAAGWSKIYWRMPRCGSVAIPQQADGPDGHASRRQLLQSSTARRGEDRPQKNEAILQKMKDRFHYETIDSLAEAVRYGHELGLEIHAWFSINEDDHAWGWPSRYTVAHPEHRWKRRDGGCYRSQLSFAHPQVRRYKLAIIREVLESYPVDGIFIDWIRTGDVRDPQVDSNGVADYGYEDVLIESFRTKFGIDPRNIPNNDLRGSNMGPNRRTEFMRSVRELADSRSPKLPVAVLVQHPWSYRGDNPQYADNLQGLLLDLETWAKDGLMDAAVPAGYYAPNSGGTPELAYEHLKQLTGGKTEIWMFAWVPRSVDDCLAEFERHVNSEAITSSIGKPITLTTTPRRRNCSR